MFPCNLGPRHFGLEVPASIVVHSSPVKRETETASQDGTNSTVSEGSEEFLMELDEIPQLLMGEMQSEQADDVVKGLKALAELLLPGSKHCAIHLQEAASCGAPSVLVLVMKKWKAHEEIQTASCCCIYYLSYEFSSCNAVVRARGLETIATTMKAFPTSKGVQFAGSGAIMKTVTIIGKETDSLVARNATRRFVRDSDGISVILRAMMQFRSYRGFQAICCEALDLLATDNECCQAMMKPNVISVVAGTLETHGEDESCRLHATSFMSKVPVA